MNWCIAVSGGSGGLGASTFAAVLAWLGGATLVDLDGVGGGLDVLLGLEREPGARWSDLRLSGGRLDPHALVGGLPRWQGTPVLAADSDPPAAGVGPVLDAARELGPVVVDMPRAPTAASAAAVGVADLAVLVVRSRVASLSAARAVLAGWPDVALGVLLRPGEVPDAQAAALLGARVLGHLPDLGRRVELATGHPPRALMAVALGVLDGLAPADGLGFTEVDDGPPPTGGDPP